MRKLKGCLKNYIWGGDKLKKMFGFKCSERIAESWEVSVHSDGLSLTDKGTLAEYLEANPKAVGKGKLPVLIKYIDATNNLSVQVHPDDEYARLHENDNGKTEMWYIMQADEGAGIYCGFNRDTDKEEFLNKLADGTVEELLNFIPVKVGDAFLIEAGTVHAICAGCVICEVQQSSNVTYRVYDYNRLDNNGKARPLHIKNAIEVLNFKKFKNPIAHCNCIDIEGNTIKTLVKCQYFTCRELTLNTFYRETNRQSFTAVNVVCGNGQINGQPFAAGDCFFLDCCECFELSGKATVLLTSCDKSGSIQ